MFRSVFQRLLFTYAAIILLVVLLLTATLTYYTTAYVFSGKQRQLVKAGEKISDLVLDFDRGRLDAKALSLEMNDIGAVSNARIYLLRSPKLSQLDQLPPGSQELGGFEQLIPDIRRIMQGETVTHRRFFVSQLGIDVVFVGLPVMKEGKAQGVLLLFSPLSEISRTLRSIYALLWGVAMLSLLAGAAGLWVVSRRISRPVEEIQRAALRMAEGEAVEDLPPQGKDEIANLTVSFNTMKNRLEQVEKMRKALIANVSHELRTPLTSIRGFLQGILDGVVEPQEEKKYLRLAYGETERLNRLVQDLLQLARLQSGTMPVQPSAFPVAEVLEEVTVAYGLAAQAKDINLAYHCEPPDLCLWADRDQVKQVLINLVTNSLNYADKAGSIEILAVAGQGKARISVRDEGPGIPPQELAFIFEKFHRVERSRSQEIPGMGLGLSIVRELILLNNGTIGVESVPGQGTLMTFELPLGEKT